MGPGTDRRSPRKLYRDSVLRTQGNLRIDDMRASVDVNIVAVLDGGEQPHHSVMGWVGVPGDEVIIQAFRASRERLDNVVNVLRRRLPGLPNGHVGLEDG